MHDSQYNINIHYCEKTFRFEMFSSDKLVMLYILKNILYVFILLQVLVVRQYIKKKNLTPDLGFCMHLSYLFSTNITVNVEQVFRTKAALVVIA